jgi:hypothetical protein
MSTARRTTRNPPMPPRLIIRAFHSATCSDRDIALLVSAHAGHWVDRRTIAGIRRGDVGYSGRTLALAFMALADVWGIGDE